MKDEPHQLLIDGLSALVIRGIMEKHVAEEVIAHYQRNFPDDPEQDKAVLWQIHKDYGLEEPK